MLHAMFVQPKTADRTPWSTNTIPGTLYATGYDMGYAGQAYLDADFENTGGSSGTTYNSGWTYRNDGVDIEACTDAGSNGYDVGWTNPGEFLGFTVNAAAGLYSVKARVSAGGSGGSIKLSVDGTDATPAIAVGGTGGWQSWQTVSVGSLGSIGLTAGTHDLKLHFITAGVNVNRLEFTMTSNAVPQASTHPPEFGLEQNYPNPFNPTTHLALSLPGREMAKVEVYDILGRKVATLLNEVKEAGTYSLTWNAADLPSGMYYCRMSAGSFTATKTMLLMK
jgi:hypothetical protein